MLQSNAADERALLSLAAVYRRIPNYEEARAALDKAVVAHPRSSKPLAALGDLEIELQRYNPAIDVLTRALALNPKDVSARTSLGVAHRARNESAAALREFDRALGDDPKHAAAYYFRGSTYADQNQNEQALADGRKAVELMPDSVPGRVLVASSLVRLGQCAEAVTILETLTAARPDDGEPLFLLSRAYQCAGQAERAKQATAQFAEVNKREQSGRENRTQSLNLVIRSGELARANQLEPALAALREAIEKDPANSNAYAQLAKIYFSAGRVDDAHRAIEQALAGNPHHPDFWYVLGRILMAQGDLPGALNAFDKTLLINPRDAEACFQKGLVHNASGQRDLALAALRKAVELDPADEQYKQALAALGQQP